MTADMRKTLARLPYAEKLRRVAELIEFSRRFRAATALDQRERKASCGNAGARIATTKTLSASVTTEDITMKAHATMNQLTFERQRRLRSHPVDFVLGLVRRDFGGNLRAYFDEIDARTKKSRNRSAVN